MPSYKDTKTGKWYCIFYYSTYEGNRKQKKKRGFRTKSEADKYEREFLQSSQYQPDMYFNDFIEMYKKDKSNKLRLHTMTRKEYKFNKIKPFFENKRVNQITSNDIQIFLDQLINEGLKSTTINNYKTELSLLFNHAIKYYRLSENPVTNVDKVRLPDEIATEMEFWTLEDYLRAIDVIDDIEQKTALNLLYWTGMRKGEMFALLWSDVDFTKNTLSISKSLQRINGKNIVTSTKTYENRVIQLPSTTIEQLKSYRKVILNNKDTDNIFIWSKRLIEKAIQVANKEAKVKRITVHALRHSHASYLISKGINIVLISKRLGHSKVSQTLDTYSHFYPSDENSMIDIIEKDFNI